MPDQPDVLLPFRERMRSPTLPLVVGRPFSLVPDLPD